MWAWRNQCKDCSYVDNYRNMNGHRFWAEQDVCPYCAGSYRNVRCRRVSEKNPKSIWWLPFTWYIYKWEVK